MIVQVEFDVILIDVSLTLLKLNNKDTSSCAVGNIISYNDLSVTAVSETRNMKNRYGKY